MSNADLVRMVNQIAANLAYLGDEEAAVMVAAHVRSFWAPPMRADLLQLAVSGEGGLGPIALQACRILDPTASVPEPATPPVS